MSPELPSPTTPPSARQELFLAYLDYFRETLVDRVAGLEEHERRESRLPSGWTPLQLLHHLRHVERRWLVWGFEGEPVPDPWADAVQGRWHVDPGLGLDELAAALREQGEVTRAVVGRHDLTEAGRPGPRWDGAPPATLERVLFHLLQEYARHAGHLDVVAELAGGAVGE
jgi:uncharacterized damage-inducible protein DinB